MLTRAEVEALNPGDEIEYSYDVMDLHYSVRAIVGNVRVDEYYVEVKTPAGKYLFGFSGEENENKTKSLKVLKKAPRKPAVGMSGLTLNELVALPVRTMLKKASDLSWVAVKTDSTHAMVQYDWSSPQIIEIEELRDERTISIEYLPKEDKK